MKRIKLDQTKYKTTTNTFILSELKLLILRITNYHAIHNTPLHVKRLTIKYILIAPLNMSNDDLTTFIKKSQKQFKQMNKKDILNIFLKAGFTEIKAIFREI